MANRTDEAAARPAGGEKRPAFYAARRRSLAGDVWTLLHPPYTAWHLSYVVIGASLAVHARVDTLLWALAAFFLAVGVAAHCLDELRGRPLRTSIPSGALVGASIVSLLGAAAIGVAGVFWVGWVVAPFIAVGVALVCVYNLEMFKGALHRDIVFALGWGAFPLLASYVAEAKSLSPAAVFAAVAATGLSQAQRSVSTRARFVRRKTAAISGVVVSTDGSETEIDEHFLLSPIEAALRALSWAVVALAVALALERFA